MKYSPRKSSVTWRIPGFAALTLFVGPLVLRSDPLVSSRRMGLPPWPTLSGSTVERTREKRMGLHLGPLFPGSLTPRTPADSCRQRGWLRLLGPQEPRSLRWLVVVPGRSFPPLPQRGLGASPGAVLHAIHSPLRCCRCTVHAHSTVGGQCSNSSRVECELRGALYVAHHQGLLPPAAREQAPGPSRLPTADRSVLLFSDVSSSRNGEQW
jgi:hypothetical protein